MFFVSIKVIPIVAGLPIIEVNTSKTANKGIVKIKKTFEQAN